MQHQKRCTDEWLGELIQGTLLCKPNCAFNLGARSTQFGCFLLLSEVTEPITRKKRLYVWVHPKGEQPLLAVMDADSRQYQMDTCDGQSAVSTAHAQT